MKTLDITCHFRFFRHIWDGAPETIWEIVSVECKTELVLPQKPRAHFDR